uniref:Secreted protein n=2 Tax=Caenorhabditis tropicalis TaxID=1561998 RepID=A0A1I7T0G4_9PELO
MAFLILSVACLAMVAANSYAPAAAADNTYGAAAADPPATYGTGNGGYGNGGGVAYPYPDESDSHSHEHKKNFRKLKDLDKSGVYDADVKYYKNRGDYYAEISCSKKNDAKEFTWILADADETSPTFNTVPGTVILAGGINVQYVAKYSRNGKWIGRDFSKDDKHKFRRVGCLSGDHTTIMDV